jgi:hypothetical protein
MSKYTIMAPGAWCTDIEPAMEDRMNELEKGTAYEHSIEVTQQFHDPSRVLRRGKGTQHRFDLSSLEAVAFLRGEAEYRWDWNLDTMKEADGPEDREYRRRNAQAAKKLMDRCDAILKAQS